MSPTDRSKDKPTGHRALAGVIGFGAAALFLASFCVPSGATRTLEVGRTTAESTSAHVLHVHGPELSLHHGSTLSETIALRFETTSGAAGTSIAAIGTGSRALQILVDPQGAVIVTTQHADRSTPQFVLLDQIAPGRTYNVRLVVDRSRSLAGWVNGTKEFQFGYGHTELDRTLAAIELGGGSAPINTFPGSVSGFTVSYRLYGAPGSGTLRTTLRLVAALLGALFVVVLLVDLAAMGWISDPTGIRSRSVVSGRRRRRLRGGQTTVSVLLVAGGIAALAVLTPVNNSVARQTGFQRISSAPVSPGQWTGAAFGSLPELLKRSPVEDIGLSLQMNVPTLPNRSPRFFHVMVAAARSNQGIEFDLTRKGALSAIIGQNYYPETTRILLSRHVPTGRWVSVDLEVRQSQSIRVSMEGKPVYAFTFAKPDLKVAPTGLTVGGGPQGTFGGSLRHVTLTVGLYGPTSPPADHVARRAGQLAGFAAVLFGIILLCRRILSGLFARSAPARPALVRVVFGTAGALVLLNVVVNLLRLQAGSPPSAARDTWLFAPYVQFSDFFQTLSILKSFNPYGIQGGSYPPLGYLSVLPLSWMSDFAAVFVFLGVFAGFMAWWSDRVFGSSFSLPGRVLLMVIVFASVPVSLGIDRANVDLWVFIVFVIAIALLERRKQALAASLLGLVAAAKIAPGIYLLHFVRKHNVRYLAVGVGLAALTTLAGFAVFDGSLTGNINGFRHALGSVESSYNGSQDGTYFNCSIYGFAQAIGFAVGGLRGSLDVRMFITPFVLPVEIGTALVLVWYLRTRETTLWRTLALMTLWFLVLQDVSYYYELLFLFVPLALFVRDASVHTRSLQIACLFGLVIGPKSYFYFSGGSVDNSVLFTAPLLIALTVAIIRDGVRERRDLDQEQLVAGSLGPRSLEGTVRPA